MGKPKSDEHRRKLSESVRAWWATNPKLTESQLRARRRNIRVCLSKQGSKIGAANPHWHGGSFVRKDGYRLVRVGRTYQLEHRLVMERHLGRKLARRENVHHKNGDKLDNRLDNLEVIDVAEHARLHARQMRSTPEIANG